MYRFANLRSGMPVRSPVMYSPGTLVEPSAFTRGNFSTTPAGQRVWSHFAYRLRSPSIMRLLGAGASSVIGGKNLPGAAPHSTHLRSENKHGWMESRTPGRSFPDGPVSGRAFR